MLLRMSMASVVAASLLMLSGCASSGDLQALTARVDALERGQASLSSRVDDVSRKADQAAQEAAASAASAKAAANRADDAARRADAMFKKSVSK